MPRPTEVKAKFKAQAFHACHAGPNTALYFQTATGVVEILISTAKFCEVKDARADYNMNLWPVKAGLPDAKSAEVAAEDPLSVCLPVLKPNGRML